jgi:hypothetical protein
MLNNLICSYSLSNPCFINQFIFNGKGYPCKFLADVIEICILAENSEELRKKIDSHLILNNYPRIERMKINYITELPSNKGISTLNKSSNLEHKSKQSHYERTEYVPCSHEGLCSYETCLCLKKGGYCEKFCFCSDFCDQKYKGCDCKDGYCNNVNCKCSFDHRECDPDVCNCSKTCKNMNMCLEKYKKTALSKSVICDNYGLFALEDIRENELISEYKGEYVGKEETDRRSVFNEMLGLNYFFQLTKSVDIDAYRIGNEMR